MALKFGFYIRDDSHELGSMIDRFRLHCRNGPKFSLAAPEAGIQS